MLPKEIFNLSDGKEVINELETERSQKMSEFNIELPNCWGDTKSLRVIADISRAEPDVGDFGNGDISVTVEEVYCTEDGFDPNENIYSAVEGRIDDIAHLIYQRFE